MDAPVSQGGRTALSRENLLVCADGAREITMAEHVWFGVEWEDSRPCKGVLVAGAGVALLLGGFGAYLSGFTALGTALTAVGGVSTVVFVSFFWRCRISLDRQNLLHATAKERSELRKYESLLKDAYDPDWPGYDEIRGTTYCDTDSGGAPQKRADDRESGDSHPLHRRDEDWREFESENAHKTARLLLETVSVACDELEAAERAIDRNNIPAFYRSYYFANRQQIYFDWFLETQGYRNADGGSSLSWDLTIREGDTDIATDHGATEHPADYLQSLSSYIRQIADRVLPEDRADEIRAMLSGRMNAVTGTRNASPVSAATLYYAVRTIHDWNVEQVRKTERAERYLRRIVSALFALLVLFLVSIPVALDRALLGSVANGVPDGWSALLLMWLTVLIGAGGAAFSIALPLSQSFHSITSDPDIPHPTIASEALFLRVLVGAVSALILVAIFLSPLARDVFVAEVLNGWTIGLVAFLSGFSERLVTDSLEKLETNLAGESNSD
jgi:hypothetical protein